MANKKMQRKKETENQIVALKAELAQNEETLKKNTENPKGQIQVGLRGKGMPQGAMMYDSLLEQMRLDIEEEQMRFDSGFVIFTPSFEFQKTPRWREMQVIRSKKALKNMKFNLDEVEKRVADVEKDVAEQTERIKKRNPQILEDIKALETKNKSQSYIG